MWKAFRAHSPARAQPSPDVVPRCGTRAQVTGEEWANYSTVGCEMCPFHAGF